MIDLFAYIWLYRRVLGGEWVYVNDSVIGICHWVRPIWLRNNRFTSDYTVLNYEHW